VIHADFAEFVDHYRRVRRYSIAQRAVEQRGLAATQDKSPDGL
jgi:hypothetical protein